MKLSISKQSKAVEFLNHNARPLEKSLYAFHFDGGSMDAVCNELSYFQNADGGFGHGLEPDVQLTDSSVIATTVAFQRLRDIHAPSEHPIVTAGCRYLNDTYNSDTVNWPIIPPNVDDAPHAPWWVYGGDLSHSLSNPRAEITGYLYEYPEHFTDAMREQVTTSVMSYLDAQNNHMEMHDLMCYMRFYEAPNLPDVIKTRLENKLRQIVEHEVARDPHQWAGYGLQPISVVSHPDSPFARSFTNEIDANLDFLMSRQHDDGYWGPNWSWGDESDQAWRNAEHDWCSFLTLANLRLLAAFSRLDERS
jgi:hypothetical protein